MWQLLERASRDVFEGFGYEEIRTPILEEAALFQKGVGEGTDIVNKEMYTLTDKGGRSLALRPEGTAPIVRSYIENRLGADDLAKLYYLGPMFRSERPQKGRSRQFHQIGVEAIGSFSAYLDVEIIVMMRALFKRLTLDEFKIKLCTLGCDKDKAKLAKELRAFLEPEKNRLCDDCKIRLKKNVLRTLDCKVESCRVVLRNSPKAKDFLCPSCTEHYDKLKAMLSSLKIDFKEDPNMVRGLDYYTRTVFEVTHPSLGAQDAVAAGGRYDNLVGDFGGARVGAAGFAIGAERLIMALSAEKNIGLQDKMLDLYAATAGPAARDEAFKSVIALRRQGIYCEMNMRDKSLKAQMREANRKKAAFTAIFGEEELGRGEVVLRSMKTSEQRNVKLSDLAKEVRKGL